MIRKITIRNRDSHSSVFLGGGDGRTVVESRFAVIVSGKNKVHMAEYRGAKFCHRCNTVDTSGFCGPGGGFLVLVAVVACHYFYYH